MKKIGLILLFVAGCFAGFLYARITPLIYTVDRCAVSLNDQEKIQGQHGWQFWFVRKEFSNGLNLKMSAVDPHQAHHGAHVHEEQEIFYVVKGTMEFTLDGKTCVMGPNSAFFCPPGVSHGVRNVGDDQAQYLVIKN